MRHIIVHYHLFKNAGSTIDSVLAKSFKDRCGFIEGENPWDTLLPEDILEYGIANPNIFSISSHTSRLPLPVSKDIRFHPILFLRHPIDRVGSVYTFEKSQPINSPNPGVKIAHEKDFSNYIRWRLSDGNGATTRNFQTIYLSGRHRNMRVAIASDCDLERAKNTLSSLPVFGVVEKFDKSLNRIETYLSQYFSNIDFTYEIENRSNERANNIEQRLHDIEKMLGDDLYSELLEKNSMDIQFYEYALKMFNT